MNIFEGARRIALVVAGIGAIIAGAVVVTNQPSVEFDYEVVMLNATPKRIQECVYSPNDATITIPRKTRDGRAYSVEICFRAHESIDGDLLVPFREDGDSFLLDSKYSDNVERYTKRVAMSFRQSPVEAAQAAEAFSSQRTENLATGFAGILGGLFAFWLFVKTVGWIVRGFAGIPHGFDRKPS